MKLEDLALKKEKDDASKERRAKLREQMDAARAELATSKPAGRRSAGLNRVGELKKQLDQAYTDRDRALREADYARASKLEYETIKRLEQEVAEAERAEANPPVSAWSTSRSPTRTSPP
jgi:ATP-dependent Clp protease ATP-binding subunit ClpB